MANSGADAVGLDAVGELGYGGGRSFAGGVELGGHVGRNGGALLGSIRQPGLVKRCHASVGAHGHVTHGFAQLRLGKGIQGRQEVGNLPQRRGGRAQTVGKRRVVALHVAAHADVAHLSLGVGFQRPHLLQVEQLAAQEQLQQAAVESVHAGFRVGGTVGRRIRRQGRQLREGLVQLLGTAADAAGGEVGQASIVLVQSNAAAGGGQEIPVFADGAFGQSSDGLVHDNYSSCRFSSCASS